jgi:hypothetical protein
VSAAGSNVAGAGGFAHGGIAPAPREAKPPAHLRPGEVYLGTTPLQTELPKAGRVTSVTYPQWAALFLPRIQAPVCGNNLVAMVAWQAQEGTRVAWNPLATTRGMPGATTFNSVGVKNYSSLEEGLQATALTLLVPAVIADFNRAFAPRSNRQ